MTPSNIIALMSLYLELKEKVYNPTDIYELERLDLAYRSVSTQTWHYSRLTEKGIKFAEELLKVSP